MRGLGVGSICVIPARKARLPPTVAGFMRKSEIAWQTARTRLGSCEPQRHEGSLMIFSKTGLILNTENYLACVRFYGEILGLTQIFAIDRPDEQLTCFELGGAYLMVETGGTAHPGAKPSALCPTKFRFNVANVRTAAEELVAKGVDVIVRHYQWGETAEFADPDGNRCALRSEEGFGKSR